MDAPAAEIVVTGRAVTPERGLEAFGAVTLDAARLAPASGRVEDGLRAIGGLQLFRRGSTRTSNPTADGLTARGLAGNAASRMAVTLDGVPLADPFFGFVAWSALLGRPVEAATVLRGGGTGSAGPGALAGVVAFRSAPAAATARLRGGGRGSADGAAAIALPVDAGGFGLFGGFARGDGHVLVAAPGPADRPARYRQWGAGGRMVADIGEGEVSGTVSAFDDRRLRGVEGADIATRGGDASLTVRLPFAWQAELGLWAQLRDFATRSFVLDSARAVATPVLDQLKTPARGVGARLALQPPTGDAVALTLGADWRRLDGRTVEMFRYVDGLPTRLREAGGGQSILGGFADLAWQASPDLVLTGALRLDGWHIGPGTLTETDLGGGAVTLSAPSRARTGSDATARAGAVWRPVPAFPIRLAAYRGWRLPTLNELHRPFRAGQDATAANPALAPERLDGVELGVGYQPLGSIDLGLTLFANRLGGAIANVTIGEGPGVFPGLGFVPAGGQARQRRNLKAVRSRGIEAEVRVAPGRIEVTGSFAMVDARVVGGELDGLRPAQAPRVSASLAVAHRTPQAEVGLVLRHVGETFEDDRNSRRLAPATVLDARAALKLAAGVRLTVEAENLTDSVVETGVSGRLTERGQPRTLWLGLDLAR